MPISFACPHCGKSTQVEDRYAGQSGPCAGCGQQITIPGTSSAMPAKTGMGAGGIIAILVALGVAGVCVIAILVALLLPAIQAARSAARRSQSMNNLKQIGLALHMYHDTHKSFPPAYVADAAGKPLYSWRVLILPYIEQNGLYEQFDKTKAWDAPENIGISSMMISVYHSPSDSSLAPNGTNYFCFMGPNTAFPKDKAISFNEMTDGSSNTLVAIETKGIAGSWAAPIDIDVATIQPVLGNAPGQIQPCYPGGTNIGLADGSVRFLPSNIAPSVLPPLIDRRDGQMVPNF